MERLPNQPENDYRPPDFMPDMTLEADLFERSKFSFDKARNRTAASESGEPLNNALGLNNDRIIIAPIWEHNPDDLEGALYLEYIAEHPNYGLAARQSVLEHLSQAINFMPDYWSVALRSGHRPLEVQTKLLASLMQKHKIDYPEATVEQNLAHARLFVADPSIKTPPHCTGGAIDIEIVNNRTGQLVDMGTPVNTDSPSAFTHSPLISELQKSNRHILLNAMLSAQFANLANEWWHFSYGDQYWAAFYDQPSAIYMPL
jgi:D-alanyl-D-alanine dipeptidase